MLQFMFDFEKDSEAAAKMATSLTPAATAASKPWLKEKKPQMSLQTDLKVLQQDIHTKKVTYFKIRC